MGTPYGRIATRGTSAQPSPENITQIGGSAVTLGQKVSANSIPVVIASDQTITVTFSAATVTANQGSANTTPWNENISQVGGAAFSLGQQLAAASLPIVLTAAQLSTLTPPSAITNYALESGGSLATVAGIVSSARAAVNPISGQAGVAGGSGVVSATTQRVVLATDVALPAGINVIGHVITDSGSVVNATLSAETTKIIGTINIASGQTVGIVAGTAVIGHVIVDSGTISNLSQIASVTPTFGDVNNSATETGAFNTAPLLRYNATQPTLTDTRYNQLQGSSRGELLVTPGVSNFAVQATLAAETTKVIGTINIASGQTVGIAAGTAEIGNVKNSGTFAVQATLAAETTKVIGTVNQGTSPWVVDTEFPAAAALGDTDANPTTPLIGAANMGWSGATWNRMFNYAPGDGANNDRGLLTNDRLQIWNSASWDRLLGAKNALNSTGTGIPTAQIVGQFDDVSPTSITENQFGNIRMSANRNLYNTIRDAAGNERGVNVTAANELLVNVVSATGSAVPANAFYTGVNAQTSLPAAATAGNLTGITGDKFGRQIVLPVTIRDLTGTQSTTISSSTSETTIVTQAASVFNDLLMLVLSNTSATATRVDFRDTTGGTVLFSLYAPAGDTRGFSLGGVAIPQTSVNTNWTAQCAAAITDLRIYAVWAKNR